MTTRWVRLPRRSGTGPATTTPDAGRERKAGGQSLVEMALAFPVLMMILLGTIDVGQMFFDYIELRNATSEGASYGARNPTDTSGITSAVNYSGVPAGTAVSTSTSGSCGTVNGTGTITVSASSVFTPLTTSFFSSFGMSTVTLNSSTTMRCLT